MSLTMLLGVADASAEPPELWKRCPTGSGAGQCDFPRGVAADPRNGHVFVVNQNNRRVEEFNALGQFIKAWGWGVDTGAAELEVCTGTSGCQAGLAGGGSGQFSAAPVGVAVDSAGSIYVTDRGLLANPNVRVQKFDRKGDFLLMFGGEVNETSGGNVCPRPGFPADDCKAGTIGTADGQFGAWGIGDFIAIDAKGTATDADDEVYVGDVNRIQVFDAAGNYQRQFPVGGTVRSLAVDEDGDLFAIFGGQTHKLSPSGEEITPPEGFDVPGGESAVAVNSEGHVFLFGPVTIATTPVDPLFEFDSDGKLLDSWGLGEFSGSTGLATNLCAGSEAPGNLYVTNASSGDAFLRAYGTEPIGCFKARTGQADPVAETEATLNGEVIPSGEAVTECFFEYGTDTEYGQTAACDPSAGEIGTGSEPVPVQAEVSELEKGTVYHFRLTAVVGGETETGSDEEFKTLGPPVISEESTTSAAHTEASLRALVNPEGFKTTYQFQYATLASFEAEGFEGALSTPLTSLGKDGDRTAHPVTANLTGLQPGTAYRWRVVAFNSSGESEGQAQAFNTYRLPSDVPDSCPNAALRRGPSALLPDCRAYEMVSPVDKNGSDINSGLTSTGEPPEAGGYVQAAPNGDKITYTALFASFCGQENSFKFNQYLATRESGGWSCEGIHPHVTGEKPTPEAIFGLNRAFMALTPDLCHAWLLDVQSPPATDEGQEGLFNLYRRHNCAPGMGALEALVPAPEVALPEGTSPQYVDRRSVQGVAADGSHAVFAANAGLTADAHGGVTSQLYDRSGGGLALVSVLPGGTADPTDAAVGSGPLHNLENAVSEDGSRVYWTSGAGAGSGGVGTIYLRLHPEQGIVAGECETSADACTLPVSVDNVAFFWGATPDGSRAIFKEDVVVEPEPGVFVSNSNLYLYDLVKAQAGEDPRTLIATDIEGVAGASEDLSRAYFVSRKAIPESGETNGEEAIEGEPNLYLAEGGGFEFIARLAEADFAEEPSADVPAYNLVEGRSIYRATRVSADGTRIAFNSRAPLTGYDNASIEDGRPAVEVFTYDAQDDELACASCNPSGARPSTRELLWPYKSPFEDVLTRQTNVPAAAWIPTWEHPLHASNALSSDGSRIFFNSNDDLLPRDTNGAPDVYEWEEPGAGSCTEAGPDYFPQSGGCLYLISSGESSYESVFWEASPDGDDVFFTTESSLVGKDPGSVDLYDARVGGGFAEPEAEAECEGEACQSPPPPPPFPTPASGAYLGPPNPRATRDCRRPGRRAAGLSRRAKRARRAARRSSAPQRSKRMHRRSKRLAGKAKRLSRNAKRCRRAARANRGAGK